MVQALAALVQLVAVHSIFPPVVLAGRLVPFEA